MRRKSGFAPTPNAAQMLGLSPSGLGQSYPQHCPPLREAGEAQAELGSPLSIREAAQVIGCSPWTVRHALIPRGLPFFRSGASGKLIFYRNQVVRWIETQQGGNQ
jgi:excisionase family DNA binding protein